jgi:cell division septation protein DedD
MASGNRRGRDWVLGGSQLAGIFILLVVLFGMVFTLGYLLGRNQYEAQIRAAASIVPGQPNSAPGRTPDKKNDKPGTPDHGPAASHKAEKPLVPPADWDFYHSAEPARPADPLAEPPKSVVPSGPSAPLAVKSASRINSSRSNLKSLKAPVIARGAIVLQVASMLRQADAVGLAQALQQKQFPAFVLPPGATSRYYRVQVGPYRDAQSADLARQKLESQGFKAITRR